LTLQLLHEALDGYRQFAGDAAGRCFPLLERSRRYGYWDWLFRLRCDCDYDRRANRVGDAVQSLNRLHLHLLRAKREKAPLAKIHS
jgi:hypothetical protein